MSTSVRVSKETHKALEEIGRKNESFDQIIKRLIEAYRKFDKKGGED